MAACQPVVDQWSSQPKHPRQVYTGAMVTDTTDKDKGAKTISLTVIASYRAGDAKAVLDELAAAVAACHGYAVVRGGVTSHFVVKPATAAAGLGDQQVSYTIGDTAKGAAGQVLVTVVRAGDTTAAFETVRADHQPAVPAQHDPGEAGRQTAHRRQGGVTRPGTPVQVPVQGPAHAPVSAPATGQDNRP